MASSHTTLIAALLAVLPLLATSQAQSQAQLPISLSVPTTAPQGASPTVNPAFCAYAFEERSFYYYSDSPLSQNLVAQVAARTNSRPAIRAGGNSLNSAYYTTDSSTSLIVPTQEQNRTIPGSITIGPGYFNAFKNFPNAQYIVDVPMNNQNSSIADSVAFAQQAWSTIGSSNILALELGNEPNSYSQYTPTDYAQEFQSYSSAIAQALQISTNTPQFQAGGLNDEPSGWGASTLFSDGLSQVQQRIKYFSAHYYQQTVRSDLLLQNNLMSHSRIVNRMAEYTPMISFLSSLSPPIPFDFGEVACGPGSLPSNTSILERFLGAALWQVDFMLYSMTVGVDRVHMQSGYGFDFSLWQPDEFDNTPAAVYANYYAQMFVAEFIGSSGAMQALELGVSPVSDTLTAYAAYEHGQIARVALVNMGYFDGTSSPASSRTSQTFTLSVPENVHNVTIATLTAPDGAMAIDTSTITWAGQTFTLANDGMGVTVGNVSTVLPVQNGMVSVPVEQSMAVMVFFDSPGNLSASATTTSAPTSGSQTPVPTGSGSGSAAGATTTHKGGAAHKGVYDVCEIVALVVGVGAWLAW